ncbi:hypothetical protein ABT124_48175 [Streptomyces sp. NPDC001982]|uniref:hypothetical protein n=1 Tax=unclassified Streptomyces TaxID=2593676 RepID=UPI003328D8C5
MSELPPDPPRLRAIPAHLDQQLADNQTVGTYLRLQLDFVRQALAVAERKAPTRQQLPYSQRLGLEAPTRTQRVRYMIDCRRTANGPQPSTSTTADR